MNGIQKSTIVRFGSGAALAAVLGISSFVPSLPQATVIVDAVAAPGEYIHVDYAKKRLICEPKGSATSTALVEDWQMPSLGMKYWFNTASIPSYLDKGQVLSAVDQAAQQWRDAGSRDLSSDGHTDSAGSITDGKNTISFGPAPSGVVGIATMRIKDGTVQEADIVLDAGTLWATNSTSLLQTGCDGVPGMFDVQNVMTHEFGHWVGAAHPRDDSTLLSSGSGNKYRTMFSDIAPGEVHKRTLTSGDKNSIPRSGSFTGTVSRGGDDDG